MARRAVERYSGTTFALVWVVVVAFGLTFWAGVACLIGRFI